MSEKIEISKTDFTQKVIEWMTTVQVNDPHVIEKLWVMLKEKK